MRTCSTCVCDARATCCGRTAHPRRSPTASDSPIKRISRARSKHVSAWRPGRSGERCVVNRRVPISFKTGGDSSAITAGMTSTARPPAREWHAALVDIMPAMVAGIPFAALCGALAVAKGLSPTEAFAMSLVVFAGGAQFAAIEIWSSPVPLFALVVSTLLINSRHVLMGVSLRPKLHALSVPQRLVGCFMLADENWAPAERRATAGTISPTYFLVMGAAFWANWVVWSFVGALLGPVLGDPKRLGADFAFVAIFIALIVSLSTGRRSGGVIAVSAVTAALVRASIRSPWHVPSGAVAGIVAAALIQSDKPGGR